MRPTHITPNRLPNGTRAMRSTAEAVKFIKKMAAARRQLGPIGATLMADLERERLHAKRQERLARLKVAAVAA